MRFVNNDFQENKEPTIGGMQPSQPLQPSQLTLDSRFPDTEMQSAHPHNQV
jgi:hypothetical protein